MLIQKAITHSLKSHFQSRNVTNMAHSTCQTLAYCQQLINDCILTFYKQDSAVDC